MAGGKTDPLDWFTLAYGSAFAILIGVLAGTLPTGFVLLLLNGGIALVAFVLLPKLRIGHRVLRFFGVTLPLLVFYLYYRETMLVLQLPDIVWRDPQVAIVEMALWEKLAPISRSPAVGEILALAYMSYVPLLLFVAAVMLGQSGGPDHPAETMVRRVCFAWGICYAVFVFVPVLGPRLLFPDLQDLRIGNGPFSAIARLNQELGMLHGAAFPSAHIAATVVATWSAWCWRRVLFWGILPVSIGITAGAICLGYHYLTDVFAGAFVAVTAVFLDRLTIKRWGLSDIPPPAQTGTASGGTLP